MSTLLDKRSGMAMAVKDLIEDWIGMRSMLLRQLEMLKSGKVGSGTIQDAMTKDTISRIERWIAELNALLKDYSRLPHD
jgi:hypothetical protein